MKKIWKGLLIVLLVFAVWVIYGFVRSTRWPVIARQEIVSDKIHSSKTICVVGDMHSKQFPDLIEQIQNEKPDLIIMAGDIFDETDTELDPTFKTIEDITTIADVYFAMGNHERKQAEKVPDFMTRLQKTGVSIIDKEYFDVDDDLRIGGLYEYPFGNDKGGYNKAADAPEEIKAYFEEYMNTDRFTVFAAHRPDSFYFGDASEVYPIDLVISAHIHGGQVILPFIGGVYGGDQGWFPKYSHGYYQKNNIHWLITSGLYSSKKKVPRFNNPPEIYIVTLNGR